MSLTRLLVKNLLRNKLRLVLTMFAIGLPMAMLLFTTGIRDFMDAEIAKAVGKLRLAVHHKMSIVHPLPERHRQAIFDLDPDRKIISGLCGLTWFGGNVPGAERLEFASLAVDAETMAFVFDEYEIDAAAEAEWLKYRNAAVVGKATADWYGWKEGAEFEFKGDLPPYMTLRLRLVKIHTGSDPRNVFFRMDFYQEELKRLGQPGGEVGMYWLKCRRAEDMNTFARKIDEAFENTPHPTKTEDESAFIAGFIKATGDFPGKLQFIGWAVVLAMTMVAANTMSLSIRERTPELAVLRALGFSRGLIARLVLAEGVLVAFFGAMAGAVPMYLLFRLCNVDDIGFGPMNRFIIPERCLLEVGLLALAAGFIAGLVPTIAVGRLNVVNGLRRSG